MPRNAEVIRQWHVLRTLERSRLGVTIDELARAANVTTRTIRRDVAALAEAGFPLFDEQVDGRTRWRLHTAALGSLAETGFTLTEAAALYFSRAVAQHSALGLLSVDLDSAFEKFAAALTPVRRFLDRLPQVLVAKRGGPFTAAPLDSKIAPRLLDAILHGTRVDMRYRSRSSRRERTYRVEPARLVSAEHELYLLAFVPEYDARRTFAVSRILSVTPLAEHFTPRNDDWDTTFMHSLGMHEGTPQRVRVWCAPAVAEYVAEREWHPSQRTESRADGGVVITLDVAVDWALKRWLLGFGADVVVLEPAGLVSEIRTELRELEARYAAAQPAAPPEVRPRAGRTHGAVDGRSQARRRVDTARRRS